MSVWDSADALFEYVYRGEHAVPLSNRKQWFEPSEGPSVVLWWIPSGHIPTIEEAKQRLDLLENEGPGPPAFTFARRFPPPEPRATARALPAA